MNSQSFSLPTPNHQEDCLSPQTTQTSKNAENSEKNFCVVSHVPLTLYLNQKNTVGQPDQHHASTLNNKSICEMFPLEFETDNGHLNLSAQDLRTGKDIACSAKDNIFGLAARMTQRNQLLQHQKQHGKTEESWLPKICERHDKRDTFKAPSFTIGNERSKLIPSIRDDHGNEANAQLLRQLKEIALLEQIQDPHHRNSDFASTCMSNTPSGERICEAEPKQGSRIWGSSPLRDSDREPAGAGNDQESPRVRALRERQRMLQGQGRLRVTVGDPLPFSSGTDTAPATDIASGSGRGDGRRPRTAPPPCSAAAAAIAIAEARALQRRTFPPPPPAEPEPERSGAGRRRRILRGPPGLGRVKVAGAQLLAWAWRRRPQSHTAAVAPLEGGGIGWRRLLCLPASSVEEG
jgi:hypothetical protein